MSSNFARDVIKPGVEQICKDERWNPDNNSHRGSAFQKWIGNLLVASDRNLETNDVSENILYSRDLGVDLVLNDENQKHCYVIQTKYLGRSGSIGDEVIRGFFSLHNDLMESDFIKGSNASNDAKDTLYDYQEQMKDGWRATWIFATNLSVSDHQKGIASSSQQGFESAGESVECRIYDLSEIERIYKINESQEQSIPDEVELTIPDGKFVLLKSPKKTLIAVVKGNFLRNLYQEHKESIFAYNIRNFMGDNGVNREIMKTAKQRPEDFFYFNNGVSAICTEFDLKGNAVHAKKFQIINGAQTVGSLSKQRQSSELLILLRLTEGEKEATDKGFNHDIIRYNNSQSAIKDSDFRSNDLIQKHIQNRFSRFKKRITLPKKIRYEPKRGGKRAAPGERVVRLEEMAKILFSYKESPAIVSESPKTLWTTGDNYEKTFGPAEGVWSEDDFYECLAALCFNYQIDVKIRELKDNAKNAGKEPGQYQYLNRLRYHILGLARVYVERYEISTKKISTDEKFFQGEFDKFWKSQIHYITPMKTEAEQKGDIKGLYNLIRNKLRWERLRKDYKLALESE